VCATPDVDRPEELAKNMYYLTRAQLRIVNKNSWFSLTTEKRNNFIHWPFCFIGQPAASTPHRNNRHHQEMKHCGLTDKPRAGNNSEQLYHETSEIISAAFHRFSQCTLRLTISSYCVTS